MAFNLTGGIGGRRSRGLPAMAEINVTPFVDVALVLLIIFMITARVMDYGIEVNVPKTKTVTSIVKDQPVVVSLTKNGDLYLGSSPVNIAKLVSEIHARFPGQTAVFVKADAETVYAPIALVTSELNAAKFGVNLVTRPDESGGKSRR